MKVTVAAAVLSTCNDYLLKQSPYLIHFMCITHPFLIRLPQNSLTALLRSHRRSCSLSAEADHIRRHLQWSCSLCGPASRLTYSLLTYSRLTHSRLTHFRLPHYRLSLQRSLLSVRVTRLLIRLIQVIVYVANSFGLYH